MPTWTPATGGPAAFGSVKLVGLWAYALPRTVPDTVVCADTIDGQHRAPIRAARNILIRRPVAIGCAMRLAAARGVPSREIASEPLSAAPGRLPCRPLVRC